MSLPILQFLPDLDKALTSGRNAVLVAEPGAGKTTRVPIHCLDSAWLAGQKIIMLEPRRLAARSAVCYMANLMGESVGGKFGFRVRGESKVSSSTRLEVVTEGILTRIVQAQPELEGIGLVIFDEFHERSLNADLALALCLEIQRELRPDLRILVMSATLDATAVATILGTTAIIRCPGRAYPVQTKYLEKKVDVALDLLVTTAIQRALKEQQGDILVFLPGRGEISWVTKRLESSTLFGDPKIFQLYSDLTSDQQDLILRKEAQGRRKIILATSIAETSLTIDGVSVVIDSGLMRVPRFDPKQSMGTLETISVSQASAEQRKGRAGRQESGFCYRLWTENQHKELRKFNQPEIFQADLASLALELSLWGQINPKNFSFLDQPSSSTYKHAVDLLTALGAIEPSGQITKHGKEICRLAIHPRIGHMLLKAVDYGIASLACDVAALLEEKSVLGDKGADLEISSRWHALDGFRRLKAAVSEKRSVFRRVDKESDRLRKLIGIKSSDPTSQKELELIGVLTAFVYPDRIAVRRELKGNTYLLRSGSGASLPDPCLLSRHKFLAIAHLDGSSVNGRIFLCEPIEESQLFKYFGSDFSLKKETVWDEKELHLKSRELKVLDSLVLSENQIPLTDDEALPVMLVAIRKMGLSSLPWGSEEKSLVKRSEWLRVSGLVQEDWPDLSTYALNENLDHWLGPYLTGVTSNLQLQKLDLMNILQGLFSWQQKQQLDSLAPSQIGLPSGSQVRVDYQAAAGPLLSVRLQEMFGQLQTPRIGNGKVALTIELLSPARRPLQITKDLESFWKNSYQDVRKEMQGRYPKHSWPIDPATAQPTRRVKGR